MEIPSEFQIANDKDTTQALAQRINGSKVDDEETMVHSQFACLCAEASLDGDFDINDPMSEMCLSSACLPNLNGPGLMSQEASETLVARYPLCNDMRVHCPGFPRDPEQRKALLKSSFDAVSKKDSRFRTPAYEWPMSCNEDNIQYYESRRLSRADAECCVWALSFYTGPGSNRSSRAASLIVRKGNMVPMNKEESSAVELMTPIFFYLATALKHLPYCWEQVTRFINLERKDVHMYRKGCIVTWLQFSSASKIKKGAELFKTRNTKFVIQSLKGRAIRRFSNYEDEDEVLFPPFTRLLILKVVEHGGNQREIHAREVELGIGSEMPLLWVDDKVLEPGFEMKNHMEYAQMARNQEIAFILKPSTDLALAYLRSPFGRRHFRKTSLLRVISDMNRPEEDNGHRAGARLVNALGAMRFAGKTLIFTSDADKAVNELMSEGVRRKVQKLSGSQQVQRNTVGVATCAECALNFVCFADTAEDSQCALM